MEMVINEDFKLALNYVERTGMSVFLTGKAGTGKTTFLKYLTERTSKRHVVLAPTGVAAINAGGVTIHSFFQLPLCLYLPDVKELLTEYQMPSRYRTMRRERLKIIRSLDLLVIDEISMVRADLLDAVDMTLRSIRRSAKPFGGVQLLMVGDAQQLSPVVKETDKEYLSRVYPSPYFFESKALKKLSYVTVELTQVFRQNDDGFLGILNSIREGKADARILTTLNSRYRPDFDPDTEGWIRLTTHNSQADEVNQRKLSTLPGDVHSFLAETEGNFSENTFPADRNLCLKKGAQVMFIRNDTSGLSRYYNGKIVQVDHIDDDGTITVIDSEGSYFQVERETWTNFSYSVGSSNEITQNVEGTFSQYPLRLAWAVTIHKSQGLTFDKVIIDAGRAFAFGQVYVALSRCRSLDGIVLSSKITYSCLFQDESISQFNRSFTSEAELADSLAQREREYSFEKIKDCFSFEGLDYGAGRLRKIFKSELEGLYPSQCRIAAEVSEEAARLADVAGRFVAQLDRLEASGDDAMIAERMDKASDYFTPALEGVSSRLIPLFKIEVDDAAVRRRLKEVSNDITMDLRILLQSMRMIKGSGFSVEAFQKIRLDALFGEQSSGKKTKAPEESGKKKSAQAYSMNITDQADDTYKGNRHPEAVQALLEWRRAASAEMGVPVYVLLHQKTLMEIADRLPQSKEELLAVYGFGKKKFEKFGREILELCENFVLS